MGIAHTNCMLTTGTYLKRIVFGVALLLSPFLYAGPTEEIPTVVAQVTRDGQPVTLQVTVVTDPKLAKEKISALNATVDEMIVTSDLPTSEVINPKEIESSVEQGRKRLGLFEIYGATKQQKIKTVVFITAQSTISAFAYVFASKLELTTAMTASVVGTAFNFYFGADPNRWDYILRWAQSKYQYGSEYVKNKIGSNSTKIDKNVEFFGPLLTTYNWRFATGYLMTGITLWNEFAEKALTHGVISRVAFTSMLGLLISGTWESIFAKWNQNEEISPLTKEQIVTTRRNRALLAALLFPMAYAGVTPAFIGLGLMAGSGVMAYILESSPAKTRFRDTVLWSSQTYQRFVRFLVETVNRPVSKELNSPCSSLF